MQHFCQKMNHFLRCINTYFMIFFPAKSYNFQYFTVLKMEVWSALGYNYILVIQFFWSFDYNNNKSEPEILPWGTTIFTTKVHVTQCSISEYWCLPAWYDSNHLLPLPLTPRPYDILGVGIWYYPVRKALEKSVRKSILNFDSVESKKWLIASKLVHFI